MSTDRPQRRWYTTWIDVDPRAMGAFRIALGLLGLWDVIRRWPWIELLYTNNGIYPNHFAMYNKGGAYFSLLHSFKSVGEVQIFFLLAAVCLFCFTIGWRTKLFQWLSAAAIMSIHNRTIIVENGGDVVFNLWWLWTLFLPLGRRYSVDAIRASMRRVVEHGSAAFNAPTIQRDTRVFRHIGVFCVIWQLSLIYVFNAIHKNGGHWHDGTAVAWAIQSERLATPLALFFRDYVPFGVTRFMTYATLVIEWAAPVLLLLPIWVTWARRIAIVSLVGLHMGIFFLMEVGLFSPVMMVSYFLLLTPPDFALFSRVFRRLAGKPIRVFFDSDCGICTWSARVGRRMDTLGQITWMGRDAAGAPPTGWTAEQLDAQRDGTLIVDDGTRLWTRSGAIYRTLAAMPLLRLLVWPMRIPGISHALDAAYDAFAARRHRFSAWVGMGMCGLNVQPAAVAPVDPEPAGWRIYLRRGGYVLGTLVVLIGFWATQTQVVKENRWMKQQFPKYRQPALARSIVSYGRWFQGWSMFAPNVPTHDGIIIIDAELQDGRRLDPITGQPARLREPHADPDLYDQFWSSVSSRIPERRRRDYVRFFNEWLRKPIPHFTLGADERIKRFKVWYVAARNVDPRTGEQRLVEQRVLTQWPKRNWEFDEPLERLPMPETPRKKAAKKQSGKTAPKPARMPKRLLKPKITPKPAKLNLNLE